MYFVLFNCICSIEKKYSYMYNMNFEDWVQRYINMYASYEIIKEYLIDHMNAFYTAIVYVFAE